MGVTKAEGIVPMEARLIAADIERYKLVEHDWFAYNPMRLNIGSIARWKGEGEILVSPDYVVFKCVTDDESGIAPSYLDHFRQTKAWGDFVTEGGDGGVRVRIYYKDIARLQLALPSLPEQQRIAECLNSVEELIGAQARKVDACKTHKKGLMQQLFPREGETQPRLRFPEFQNAGDWGAGSLGGLSRIVRGGSPRPIDSFITTDAGGLNWLKIGDVDKEAKFVTRTAERVRPEALSKTRVVHPGDLILSNSMSFGRPYILQITTCIHDGWIAITQIANEADREFLYYSISAPSSQSYFVNSAAGGGVQNLNADVIKGLPVRYPTIPEQQRIASCLSSLDALIAAEVRKLKALRTHKMGLLQQLFRSPDQVDA